MTNSVREKIYWPCSVEYVPSKNYVILWEKEI